MWAVIGVWDISPEADARRCHQDMLDQGATEPPGVRCVVWDVAEVGAESQAP